VSMMPCRMETADKHSRFGKINAFANILPPVGDVKEMTGFHQCTRLAKLYRDANATVFVRIPISQLSEPVKPAARCWIHPGRKGVGLGWSSRHSLECRSGLFNHRTEKTDSPGFFLLVRLSIGGCLSGLRPPCRDCRLIPPLLRLSRRGIFRGLHSARFCPNSFSAAIPVRPLSPAATRYPIRG